MGTPTSDLRVFYGSFYAQNGFAALQTIDVKKNVKIKRRALAAPCHAKCNYALFCRK